MRIARLAALLVAGVFLTVSAGAADVPRSARLAKDAGNQFLAAKKYSDAIDCYFQSLEVYPNYPETHYNLGVAFLKGYGATGLALHHFEKYLSLAPTASDRASVAALVLALRDRVVPVPETKGQVLRVVAGRLVVSGTNWVKVGDRIEIAAAGEAPRASLIAGYVYPDQVITQRIWDQGTLDQMKAGLVAVNASDRIYGR